MAIASSSWKILGASVAGTSHHASGVPCQDHWSALELDPADGDCLLLCCADGAGSAAHSQRGAEVACARFIQGMAKRVAESTASGPPTRDDLLQVYRQVVAGIELAAAGMGTHVRELACTLLGVMVTAHTAIFTQLGDGAIVIGDGGIYRPVFWPQAGEFAGTTSFVTGGALEDDLLFQAIDRRIDEVAIFTDGLERLLLDFEVKAAHQPFFVPTFRTLREAQDVDALEAPFRAMLASSRVTERTDDDKTLALAVRTSAAPAGEHPAE